MRQCCAAKLLTRFLLITLTLTTLGVTSATAEGGQRHRHRWWKSGEIKAELQISDAQSASIEEIYSSTVPALRALMNTLDQEEHQLSRHIADMNIAEWELTLQIDKVEAARSALSKKRILMLYHIRQELTPDQRAELRDIEMRQREERERAEKGAPRCH